MNWSIVKSGSLGAASLLTAALLAGPALADGLPGRGRIAGPAPACSFSGNVAVTSDYVFRGVSQTLNDPALQGGVEAACGKFYLGFWGSNVDFGDGETNVEMDLYAGFKTTTGPVSWDVGVIYYGYPGGASSADFVEIKVGASGDIWKGGTLGGTVFYSPEYTGNSGPTWTFEGAFSQALPKVGMFTPTFSATLGTVTFSDDSDDNYVYWNAGVTLGFLEKWSLDLRYWDTDVDGGCPVAGVGRICDERFIATVKYSF
jgi:uncharacterized protein (TIGR02001 family)